MQKENIVNIFRNNSRITHNRKVIQDKIVEVDAISKKAQDLVANFHELLYKDDWSILYIIVFKSTFLIFPVAVWGNFKNNISSGIKLILLSLPAKNS